MNKNNTNIYNSNNNSTNAGYLTSRKNPLENNNNKKINVVISPISKVSRNNTNGNLNNNNKEYLSSLTSRQSLNASKKKILGGNIINKGVNIIDKEKHVATSGDKKIKAINNKISKHDKKNKNSTTININWKINLDTQNNK